MSPDAMPTTDSDANPCSGNIEPFDSMNEQAKRKWIEYLETGDHNKKSEGALLTLKMCPETGRTKRLYSAVGLLCLAYQQLLSRGDFVNAGFADACGNFSDTGAPKDVLAWAGLLKNGPGVQLHAHNEQFTVVAMNDGLSIFDPCPFEEIAETIKTEL